VSSAAGIAITAWKKASFQIESVTSVTESSTVIIGPHTSMINPSPLTALNLVSRLYASETRVANAYLIYYSQTDIDWAQTQFDNLYDHSVGGAGAALNNCKTTETCWGASSWVNNEGDGVMLVAVGIVDTNHTSGTLEAHEYTHTVQMIQAPHDYYSLPHWLLEGGAEWSQAAAIFHSNSSQYLTERKNDTADLFRSPGTYTTEWLTQYLNPAPESWAYWNAYENWRLYDVGFLATEALVSLKGPISMMNLYADVGRGQTFIQAFETEFGTTWATAVPILAASIHAELVAG
jgi:hypothetical protein